MLPILLVLACTGPDTEATETDTEVSSRMFDLEDSEWWRLDSATFLPEQPGDNFCANASPENWDWVEGVYEEAGTCWSASGSCFQDLAFTSDGSVAHYVYFLVLKCDEEDWTAVQGIEDYGTWSFVSDDGVSSTTYEVNGDQWVVEDLSMFGWDVTVGEHVFSIAPETLEIPITE